MITLSKLSIRLRNTKICRTAWPIFWGFIVLLGTCSFLVPQTAESVTVEPGNPSSIEIRTPNTTRAGQPFQLTIIVRDQEGNKVTDYDELDRQILLTSNGDGDLSKTSISSKTFNEGEANVSMKYEVAENIRIFSREKEGVATGQSKEFEVRAGPPRSFNVKVPEQVRAGQPFTVTMVVFDQFGNRVYRYRDNTNGVSLETSGSELPQPDFIPSEQFQDGRLKTEITYEAAEEIKLVLFDEVNGIESVSRKIQVQPAPLHQFTVSLPQDAQAGKTFRLAVEGRDQYGNIIRNYRKQGSGVDLSVPGGGEIDPSYISPSKFEGGVAFVEASYEKTGTLKIRAQDRGAAVEGESSRLDIKAGKLNTFKVKVPEEVRAGQKFTATIEPRDRFGNTIRNFDERGKSVVMNVRGSEFSSKTVEGEQFNQGVVKTTFQHTNVGKFRLEARSSSNDQISGQSNSFVVIPGSPGKISVDVPDQVRAGENFTTILNIEDQYGNPIRETGNLSGQIRVNLLSDENSEEKILTPSHFIDGKKRVVFRNQNADSVSIFVEYTNHDIRSRSDPITIVPGNFNQVSVSAPGTVMAGSTFPVTVKLLDQFGNELREIPPELDQLKLSATGNGDIEPSIISREKISSPEFEVELRYYIAETTSIEIHNTAGRQIGITAPIRIAPGPVDSFNIQVPETVTTDEKFPLRLEAKDPYQNTITNLNQRSGNISIKSTGDSPVSPSELEFRQFVDGVIELPVRYRNAERMKLVLETNETQILTDLIQVQPGDPVRFTVNTQNVTRAGEPFPAVIKAYDEYGNLATNLSSDFHGVRLSSRGSNKIIPRKISRSLFDDGEANVFLAFSKTGRMGINATSLENDIEHPIINNFLLDRKVGTGIIQVLGSTALPADVDISNEKNIQVIFKPANLTTGEQSQNFSGWFVKRIRQRQDQYGQLPSVSLRLFSRSQVNVQTSKELNLFRMSVTTSSKGESPTLDEVQNLIKNRQFNEASQKLSQYMKENPDDQKAIQLRFRLQRLKEVLGQ